MPGSEKPDPPAGSLGDKLDELESLIDDGDEQDDSPGAGARGGGDLPVLDELIEPGVERPAPDDPDVEYRSDADQLAELATRLEQRLTGEMEEVMRVLKEVIRRHIKQELHDTLRRESDLVDHPDPRRNGDSDPD